MKKLKQFLKNGCVKMSAQMLCATATMFALMMCHGKIYEPKMPEKLKR